MANTPTPSNFKELEGTAEVVWYLDLNLPVQSMHITTYAESSNPDQARYTPFNIMSYSLAVTYGRSVVFSGFIHQKYWLPRNNWNIGESGVKHHNPNEL